MGTHVGEQRVDDLLVREVVGVVHDLLDLVHVGVDLGVPVHEEADLLGLVAHGSTAPSVVTTQSSLGVVPE